MSYTDKQVDFIINLVENTELTYEEIAVKFNEKYSDVKTPNSIKKTYYRNLSDLKEECLKQKPKVLILDIESAPILAHVWNLFDQNVALNQIKSDWHILSIAAKWLHDSEDKVVYYDQRNAKNIEDDSELLKVIWKLLDESDITLTQNGVRFDLKKLNARFIQHGFPPPSSYRNIDTLQIAKAKFGFTSNKLEYMTDKLCKKYKKLKHPKFSGFELWKECLAGNLEAWEEMKAYNIMDILSLEELFLVLAPWDNSINFDVFRDDFNNICSACDSSSFSKKGFKYSNLGKYQRYVCDCCGKEYTSRDNLLTKEKRRSLRK